MSKILQPKDYVEKGTWKGKEQWKCTLCPYSTLDGEAAASAHVWQRHMGVGPPQPQEVQQTMITDSQGQPVNEASLDALRKHVEGSSIDDLVRQVAAGDLDAEAVLAVEEARPQDKQRKTLAEKLRGE